MRVDDEDVVICVLVGVVWVFNLYDVGWLLRFLKIFDLICLILLCFPLCLGDLLSPPYL